MSKCRRRAEDHPGMLKLSALGNWAQGSHFQNVLREWKKSLQHPMSATSWAHSDIPVAIFTPFALLLHFFWIVSAVGLRSSLAHLPLCSHHCHPHISQGWVFFQDFLKFCILSQIMVRLFHNQTTGSLFHRVSQTCRTVTAGEEVP